MKQIKQIILTGILLFCIAPALTAQTRKTGNKKVISKYTVTKPLPQKQAIVSKQLKDFKQLAAQAGVTFSFPAGFREIKAPNNEDFSFDYAVELPGREFEIWFQVKSLKENWTSYIKTNAYKETRLANPDSLYLGMGTAHAAAFAGDNNYFPRTIPPPIAARYGADAGRSYLINLADMAVTKHYKYALLITLQKDRTGTILAVCFSNEKGPEFFNNIDKASHCIKFKP